MPRILTMMLAVFAAMAAGADDVAFEAILARIDTPRGVAIPFVEKRKNPLLEEPLVLTGEVAFDEDGRLSKTIESPFRERVTISRDAVELERDGRTRRLSLRRKDDVRSFYFALRALLEGDAKILDELFRIETTTDAARWTLVLVPEAPPLSEFLQSMVISGCSARVSRIRTVQSEDDWQEMTFDTGGAE